MLTLSREQSIAFHYLTDPRFKDITRIVFGGQAGGGKTLLASFYLTHICMTYPLSRMYMARETLKDIKESILLTYLELSDTLGVKVKYSEQKGLLLYPNGSSIYLKEVFAFPSDPDFNSLGSREYTGGVIEEGVNVSKKAASILVSRTRFKHTKYGLTPKQLITCNPGNGWIKDEIVVPQREGRRPKNAVFISASLQSNPDKEFVEGYMKNLEENLAAYDRARLLYGDWDAKEKTGAEYLKEFVADRHAVYSNEYDPNLPVHLSFDENVNPYITCQVWQVEGKTLKMIKEFCLRPPANSRQHVCRAVANYLGGHTSGMFIYGDATSIKSETGKEYGENFFTDILTYLSQYHPVMRVPSKNPSVMSRAGFLNLIFERNYREIDIQINRKCTEAINDFSSALEDANGGISKKTTTDPVTKVTYQKHGHHCDALSYFVCEVLINDYIYYLNGSVNPSYVVGNDRGYVFNR